MTQKNQVVTVSRIETYTLPEKYQDVLGEKSIMYYSNQYIVVLDIQWVTLGGGHQITDKHVQSGDKGKVEHPIIDGEQYITKLCKDIVKSKEGCGIAFSQPLLLVTIYKLHNKTGHYLLLAWTKRF